MLEHYRKEEQSFVKRCIEYKKLVNNNNKVILTNFLNRREQAILKQILGKEILELKVYGGYQKAERNKVLLCNTDFYVDNFEITCFKIIYNKRNKTLRHKDILGTLLSLQIKREVIGDIVFDKSDNPYIFVNSQMETFLLENLNIVSNVTVSLERIVDTEIDFYDNSVEDELIVSSFRLDVLVAGLINKSRRVSNELILKGDVTLNWTVNTNVSEMITLGDTISIRRFGRFTVTNVLRETKKGRTIIKIKKYVNV